MTDTPNPAAAPAPDRLPALLNMASAKRGPAFVSLCGMIAKLTPRDLYRAGNLVQRHARDKLAEVEGDIMRHRHFGRESKAAQLEQFRKLYARIIDVANAGCLIIDGMNGADPEDTAEFLSDLVTVSVALVGADIDIDGARFLPPSMRAGVPDAWKDEPTPTGDGPEAGLPDSAGDGTPAPFAGMPPGSALT